MLNSSLDNREKERRLFLNRMTASFVFIALLLLALAGRLFYLQVVQNEHHEARSQTNRLEVLPIPPIRGLIYDRYGELLARNEPSHTLSIVVERAEDLESLVQELGALVELSEAQVSRFFDRVLPPAI